MRILGAGARNDVEWPLADHNQLADSSPPQAEACPTVILACALQAHAYCSPCRTGRRLPFNPAHNAARGGWVRDKLGALRFRAGRCALKPPLQAKARSIQRGVTLLEMLIVMTIVALLAGLSYPSVSSGIDSMRLRAASDQVASFLNVAMDRSDRRQQVVEIRVIPSENTLGARSADASFDRRVEIPDSVRIASVEPVLENSAETNSPRRFLLYPGGTLPRIVIGLVSKEGRRRQVIVDPVTGMPRSEAK